MKLITVFEQELLTSHSKQGKASYFPEFIKMASELEVGNGKLFVTKNEWLAAGYSKGTKPSSIICNKEKIYAQN